MKLSALFVVALGAFGTARAQSPLQLTLDSAVTIAEKGATAVLLAQDVKRVSGALVLERYGQFLPDLQGHSAFDQYVGNTLLSGRDIRPTETRFRDLGYQVSTTLNLFNGFADAAGLKAALATRSAADLSLARVEQTIALDVVQSYLRAVLDADLVSIARQNLTASMQRVDQLQALVNVGKRSPADLYREQAQAATDRSTLSDVQNRVQTDDIALLERLRLDPHQPVALAPPAADTLPLADTYLHEDSLITEAVARRVDLRAATEQVTATREEITRQRSGYLPRLDLGAAVFSSGRFFDYGSADGVSIITHPQTPLWDQVGRQTTGILSIGFNWTIFDRFRTHLAVEEAHANYDAARYADEDLRNSIVGDVAQALGDYRTSVEQLAATGAALDAAQQAYQLVNGRFAVGFASIVDVTTAQTALVDAQSRRAQAIVSLALRKRAVAYAIGLDPGRPLP